MTDIKPQENLQRKTTSESSSAYRASSSEHEPYEKKVLPKVAEEARSPYKYPKTTGPSAQSPQLNPIRSNFSGHSGASKSQPASRIPAVPVGTRNHSQYEKVDVTHPPTSPTPKEPPSNYLMSIFDEVLQRLFCF